MLKHRIQSGLLFGALLLSAAFWLPPITALVILLIIAGWATWEFYSLLSCASIPNFRALGMLGGLGLILASWFSRSAGRYSYEFEYLVLLVIVVAVLVKQLVAKSHARPIEAMASTLLGVLYVSFLLNFITKLLTLSVEEDGRLCVLYMIFVVKCTDIGAYFIGCSFGKHKVFPRISPGKTWEGCIGGVATGILVSLVWFFCTKGNLGVVQLTGMHSVVLGLLLALTGILGDVIESLFKRAAELKDSGKMVWGMGGILDVIDSLLFAAPVMFLYVRFLI